MDNKKWYQSKAVWGGIIAIGASVAGYFGYSIGAEDQANLAELLVTLTGAGGGILAIYGRIKASKNIG